MALSEWFETYGSSRAKRDSVAKQRPEGRGQRPSNPVAKAPPKRRRRLGGSLSSGFEP